MTRLRELEDQGIIERRARSSGTGHEYWLTPPLARHSGRLSARWDIGVWCTRGMRSSRRTLILSSLYGVFRKRAIRDAIDRRVVARFEFASVPANRTKYRGAVAGPRSSRRRGLRQGSRLRSRRYFPRQDRRFRWGVLVISDVAAGRRQRDRR
ncbi:hypothetical protein I6F37_04255 [Bradyrhizobium sp. NBAIM08]|nr:hypothetical protein [Bradyrhizobium sp. NBAIM08]